MRNLITRIDPEILARIGSVQGATSRREAIGGLGKAGIAVALASLPMMLAGSARRAFAQGIPQPVTDVLNFALTLEYLESEFYIAGTGAAGLIPDAEAQQIFTTIRDHEIAHVEFLEGALGAQAVAKPTFDFTAGGMFDPFNDYATFLLLAQAFEDTGVRAYQGAAPDLFAADATDVLVQALTIHSVEARHAARVRRLRGLQGWIPFDQPDAPAPVAPVYAGMDRTTVAGVNVPSVSGISAETVTEAYDEPLTMEAVLAIVDPFIADATSRERARA